MDLPTARAAQENIISLFKDPGMHKKMLGQSNSRGRIMGALLATRSQENGKFKELEKIKKVAGAFVGDQKFQI